MARDAVMAGMGRLVGFLGAAAGVGKTHAMLGEARLAAEEGVAVVIGYLESHGRPTTEERARGPERAPVVEMGPGGRSGTEMDVPWLLERRPSVVLVDELAHSYAIGDPPRRRHQDVAELRRRGIEVWTTLNVLHMETLSDRVARLTGTPVRETVPDRLVHEADEVRLVDLSPAALRERVARGLVYPAPRVEGALTGFFTVANLAALRALVLHELAEAAAAQYEAPAARRDALEQLATGLGASVLRRTAEDPTETVVREARDGAVTRLVVLHPDDGGMLQPGRLRPLQRTLRRLPAVHVILVPRGV